jgi:GT2 family glycosyltransferase
VSRVDLVIPTHNGAALLARCLRSLCVATFTDFRLIVFDDASTEDIEGTVRGIWPEVTLLRSERNIGLARACNLACAVSDSEFVVLLNNDTEVEPSWLAELVACADRHPDAGSVASKLRLLSDRRRLHATGDYYSVRGMPGNRGVWTEDVGQFDREEPVFSACGAAVLYRRSALDAVALDGGQVFDERLFMYCEDVDLGWRLQRAGWSCWYAPKAVVYHALSATGGGTLASYYVARNVWLVLARSVPDGLLRPYRDRIIAYHTGRLWRALRHVREPAARATVRGMLSGIVGALRAGDRAPAVNRLEQQRLLALLHDPR